MSMSPIMKNIYEYYIGVFIANSINVALEFSLTQLDTRATKMLCLQMVIRNQIIRNDRAEYLFYKHLLLQALT